MQRVWNNHAHILIDFIVHLINERSLMESKIIAYDENTRSEN